MLKKLLGELRKIVDFSKGGVNAVAAADVGQENLNP